MFLINNLNWSIVFKISKQNIQSIQYKGFNKKTNEIFFGILPLNNIEYIILQTRPYYNFIDSFKKYAFNPKSFYVSMELNQPNRLFFQLEELQLVETDKNVLFDNENKMFWDIEIVIKTNTDWYKQYIESLKKHIDNEKNRIEYIENFIKEL